MAFASIVLRTTPAARLDAGWRVGRQRRPALGHGVGQLGQDQAQRADFDESAIDSTVTGVTMKEWARTITPNDWEGNSMAKTRKKTTPGQKLWIGLYRAVCYDQEAGQIAVPPGSSSLNPERATKRWLEGMSRHLRECFSSGLREHRDELRLTQQQLADIAELTVTAVAMIERGERAPNLDTVARLCWALDVAAGVTLDELS